MMRYLLKCSNIKRGKIKKQNDNPIINRIINKKNCLTVSIYTIINQLV